MSNLEDQLANSEVQELKDALRDAQNEVKDYQGKLMGFEKMRRDLAQKTQEVQKLNTVIEKRDKKMASISRLAWGAQVVMQHVNKPDDERIRILTAEVERLCLELADKDQMLEDAKIKCGISSLDTLAEHVGTELPSKTLRARTAARARTARGAGRNNLGMPGEVPQDIVTPEQTVQSMETAVDNTSLHSQEWQALFLRKQRAIEGYRQVWIKEVAELGGLVEHLHEEGHTEVSFDDFILMLKTVRGEPVVAREDPEEKALIDALEAGVHFVLNMGGPPPMPEEIRQLEQAIEDLEGQLSRAHEERVVVEKAWQEEKAKATYATEPASGTDQVQINPLQLRKCGAVIKQMQGGGYNNEQINDVCRALFLSQSEEDMATAFNIFDKDEGGYLDASEFRKALPLLGENMLPSQVDKLFEDVDTDGSGQIEFPEFCVMVKSMNPKDEE